MLMKTKKINCFISSSVEDLDIAKEISYHLQKEGIEAATWANESFIVGMSVPENLQNVISNSDFVIFIVPSEKTERNSNRENLFFEMGIIVGMGKPLLTLVRADSKIHLPSDLSSMLYLRYDPTNKETSLKHIRNWAIHSLKD